MAQPAAAAAHPPDAKEANPSNRALTHAPGSEGKPLTKGSHKGKAIGVWTSGGDSQGMNAAVRAVVRMGMYLGCKVYLIREGYQGMIDGGENIELATWKSVSGIIHMGGTVIGSARCMDVKEREGRLKAAANLIHNGISNLVCIGGDGSLTGADVIHQEWASLVAELVELKTVTAIEAKVCEHINIVGIVGSIDNDFCGTDMTIGTDSALFRIIESIDSIVTTAYSHKRCFVLEVMGRHCGYLAVVSALAGEADYVFAPEWPPENWKEDMCHKLELAKNRGQRVCIVIVSEGAIDRCNAPITANQVKDIIVQQVGLDTRVTILGHIQRGGNPSAYDRILGSRMGADAVLALLEADPTSVPVVIGIDGNQLIRIPLMEAVQKTKNCAAAVDGGDFREAVELRGRGFKFNLETYLMFSKVDPSSALDGGKKKRVMGVITVGQPVCGMNAAVRAFVRFSVTHGFLVLGIHDGFEGLVNNEVEELSWDDVTGWSSMGGSYLRANCVSPERVGLERVSLAMKKHSFSALLIIGGFEAFSSALVLAEGRPQYPEFCIPMCVLPATISNNVPGTDFSIGSDTALNQIVDICDRLNMTAAGGQNRVFICETLGGYCGYLATMSAVAGGADAAYIYEEPFSIQDIQDDVSHLLKKINGGVQRGLVLRSEHANEHFNTDFLLRLYAAEGKGSFSVKANVLGQIQEGGRPSPFDRYLAVKMGTKCSEKLMTQMLEYGGSSGAVAGTFATSRETCTLLGMVRRTQAFLSVQDLAKEADLIHQLPVDLWWLKLRPLMRILAKHDSVYRTSLQNLASGNSPERRYAVTSEAAYNYSGRVVDGVCHRLGSGQRIITIYSWLHPSLTAVQAEELLRTEGKVGSFLVRPSQSGTSSYSLSVRLPDSITHLRINNDGDCFDILGPTGGETFASLSALVRYYMDGGEGSMLLKETNGNVIDMKYPLPTCDHSNERFFHRNLSGEEAESVLKPFKAGWFLVRESKQQKGNFVICVRTDSEKMPYMHVFITFKNGKYGIGDDIYFTSLAQLVYHYRSHSIADRSGVKVTLIQAVDMTLFPSSDIGVRVAQLEKVFNVNGEMRDGFWEEFEHLQSQENELKQTFEAGCMAENRKKNRYKNILPCDHTRIKLQNVDRKVPGSDYINANEIKVGHGVMPFTHKGCPRKYIAAQGCTQNTVSDFWQMLWEEKCSIIVMLTQLNEGGKIKCAQYWPNESDAAWRLPIYNATIVIEPISSEEITKDLILRTFQLSKETSKGKLKDSRKVYQYHFLEWPDKKVPTAADAGTALTLLEKVDERWRADKYAGPLVVHCSAGIGRTGTYIVIDILLHELKVTENRCGIDVSKTIKLLRESRPGLVQVWHQYRFIYIAVKKSMDNRASPAAVAQNMLSQSPDLYENIGLFATSAESSAPCNPKATPKIAAKSVPPIPLPSKSLTASSSVRQKKPPVAAITRSMDGSGDRQTTQTGLQQIYQNIGEIVLPEQPVKRH